MVLLTRWCQVFLLCLLLNGAAAFEAIIGADGLEDKSGSECVDQLEQCSFWATHNECSKNPGFMLVECMKSCNVCPDPNKPAQICKDEHEKCEEWASLGECPKNPSYMVMNCAKSCRTCHLLDADVRCRPMPGRVAAMKPGDLNQTFARILSDFKHLDPEVLSTDPWVVVLNSFLSDEEADSLKEGGAAQGFTVSVDAGKRLASGKFEEIRSKSRTSETAWCVDDVCTKRKEIETVTARIEDISRIPYANSEYLQILHYDVGQYYVKHHDYIPGHDNMPCGGRVYTLFMYLSDVEEGGGTAFNKLGIEVKPKKGRAVLWPSVKNEDPFKSDPRTQHEAKPVIKGEKYGANAWLHMYDFKAPFKVGCTG